LSNRVAKIFAQPVAEMIDATQLALSRTAARDASPRLLALIADQLQLAAILALSRATGICAIINLAASSNPMVMRLVAIQTHHPIKALTPTIASRLIRTEFHIATITIRTKLKTPSHQAREFFYSSNSATAI
jgi:hypothetical protein